MYHCQAVKLATAAEIDYDHTCDREENHGAPHHCFCGEEW